MDMESNGLKRKDTTKGPPLRILSLGMCPPKTAQRAASQLLTRCQMAGAYAATPCF